MSTPQAKSVGAKTFITRYLTAMIWKKRISVPYAKLPSGGDDHGGKHDSNQCVRKGHIPLIVGREGGVKERFMVPAKFIKHPSVVELLEQSADELGYDHQGVLRVLCEPHQFREIIAMVSKNK